MPSTCSKCHGIDEPLCSNGQCRRCRREDARQDRVDNPERTAVVDRKRRLARYGLSPEQYDELLVLQDYGCAICEGINVDGRDLHVDHDHVSGAIRGLLCFRCNATLGQVEDNPVLLHKLADYLERRSCLQL